MVDPKAYAVADEDQRLTLGVAPLVGPRGSWFLGRFALPALTSLRPGGFLASLFLDRCSRRILSRSQIVAPARITASRPMMLTRLKLTLPIVLRDSVVAMWSGQRDDTPEPPLGRRRASRGSVGGPSECRVQSAGCSVPSAGAEC